MAVTGSAHHQPRTAFAPRPMSKAADRYAQSMFWRPSDLVADEPSLSPTRAFVTASGGIVASVTTESPMPIQLTSA
jgi:hypothetical protein